MLSLILILDILFLIITVLFFIKMRMDLDTMKLKSKDFNKDKKYGEELEELKARLLGLEERIGSVEQDISDLSKLVSHMAYREDRNKDLSAKDVDERRSSKNINNYELCNHNPSAFTKTPKISGFHAGMGSEDSQVSSSQSASNEDRVSRVGLHDVIMTLFRQGKKEDEIAGILGISLEEVKLTLRVSERARR